MCSFHCTSTNMTVQLIAIGILYCIITWACTRQMQSRSWCDGRRTRLCCPHISLSLSSCLCFCSVCCVDLFDSSLYNRLPYIYKVLHTPGNVKKLMLHMLHLDMCGIRNILHACFCLKFRQVALDSALWYIFYIPNAICSNDIFCLVWSNFFGMTKYVTVNCKHIFTYRDLLYFVNYFDQLFG